MFQDGPKRQGRFLKAGSKVLEKIALQEFAFRDLNQVPIVSHDNAQRTVIHSRFHSDTELGEGLKYPDKFDADLQPDSMRRPVLIPLDFTKDWERDRRLRKSRVARTNDDEDEEFDYEATIRQARLEQELGKEEAAAVMDAESRGIEGAHEAAIAAKMAKHSAVASAGAKPAAAAVPGVDEDPASAMQRAAQSGFRIQKDGDAKAERQSIMSEATEAFNSSFIPMTGTTAPGTTAPGTGTGTGTGSPAATTMPEDQAIAAYRARPEEQAAREEEFDKEIERAKVEIQKMADEARATGYREGFRLGEERAEIKAREHAAQTFSKVGELVSELSKLKTTILDNVQDNFYEICQAMAEALFQREFSLDPQSFASVVRRAVADTVGKDEFTVKVHPSMFERLASLNLPELAGRLAKDPELAPGDFRVESKLSVVDVSLRQTIQDLLNQADLGLVETDKTTDKAG